ncbi:MAG: HD domain-containing phosphohydrolase [Methylococcaceae bacterium]
MENAPHMEEKITKYIEQFKIATQHLDHADDRLIKLNIKFVQTLSRIVESRPGIKSGQSKFIAEKAFLIAEGLDISEIDKKNILYAALLLPLGKSLLPNSLLTKPFYSMSIVDKYRYLGHAVDGEALLKGLPQFEAAALLMRHQFERYDGQGFPDGLAQKHIPLGSRILSVVSDYNAYIDGSMTGHVMFADIVISQLMIRKESYYDAEVVDVFVNVLSGATVEELKAAIAKAKLVSIATERWQKGLVLNNRNRANSAVPIVEISLPQLKLGMKVNSIFFGSEPYIRNCTVDQTIIDSVTVLKKSSGTNPIIKIFLNLS